MNRQRREVKVDVERFVSFNDVLSRLSEPPKQGANKKSRSNPPTERWSSGVDYDGAVDLLHDGWRGGVDAASELLDALEIRPARDTKLRWGHGVTGARPDPAAYLSGRPEYMLTPERRIAVGVGTRYLTLYVNVGFHHRIDSRTALARGAAYMALLDRLESSGVRCAVRAAEWSKCSGKETGYIFDLKEYEDPFHPDALAFVVAHPAFLRRIVFALMERSPIPEVVQSTSGGSYGYPIRNIDVFGLEDDAIIFQTMHHDESDPEAHLMELMMQLPDDVRDLIDYRKETQ